MKVEIWSDVVCPFCYIGKRRFEKALEKFEHKDEVEVVWHSFELDPEREYVPGKTIHQMLAEKKGWTLEQAKEMNDRVSRMAKEVGLTYDFDKAVPANTFNAHRIAHLAAKHKVQARMEELLFSSYFTKGLNIDSEETLAELANEAGINRQEAERVLQSDEYALAVRGDEAEAGQLGITGVPFFVFNRKYAVSGAQAEGIFLQTLNALWKEGDKTGKVS